MKFTYGSKVEVIRPGLVDCYVVQGHRSRESMIQHAAKALVSGKRVKVCVRIEAGDEFWFSPHIVEIAP